MGKLTKQEVKKRVKETLVEVLSQSGIMTPAEAKKGIGAVFSKAPSEKDFVHAVISTMFYEYAENEMNRLIRRGGTEEQLETILAQMKANALGMPTMLRKELEGIRKKLPRRGGPGRNYALNPAQAIEACELISMQFKTKKLSLPDIFQSVAEAFCVKGTTVSAQTIKRVWAKRDSLYTG